MESKKARRIRRWLLAGVWLAAGLVLPPLAGAADKHPAPPGDQECGECHAEQAAVWSAGKHGLMNVKCVVCHGDPESNFVSQPALVRCRGCHADQVRDVEKKLAAGEQSCFGCHDHHTVAPKAAALTDKKGFHQGGAQ